MDGPPTLAPGESAIVCFGLLYQKLGVDYSALTPGTGFRVVEGPHTVATGVVRRSFDGPEPHAFPVG